MRSSGDRTGAKRGWFRPTLGILGAVALASGGVIAGVLLTEGEVPEALRPADALTQSVLSERSFDDSRAAELSITGGAQRALRAPVSGRITALTCTPGTDVTRGSVPFAIDGVSAVALGGAQPPWRDLVQGDTGADVLALRAELRELGHSVSDRGGVDSALLSATGALLKKAGVTPADPATIAQANIAWLSPGPAGATGCPLGVGEQAEEGRTIIALPDTLAAVSLSALPENPVEGTRLVEVNGQRYPIDAATGAVTDPDALAAIIAGERIPADQSAGAGSIRTVGARFVLADPVTAWVTAPSALYAVESSTACVSSEGELYRVSLLGSQLGQSFLRFADGVTPPRALDLTPDPAAACG
ncbi:hypothetical protein D9V32_02370 [Mycetocola tolaasinivorans]|uniref:Peptidoglycan-binding protein n=1 Tax=Mycetocola tolaasinivorans TaxID=76635 RepID=A0A3L7AA38_9MICO|nr:hypothetical protein [Mycetocola tolaasinivorans]RLP77316.1 hypothetical protein D9V32_02370 [Mycetocola tolaasinivorans]